MTRSIIYARDIHGGIGFKGDLPWPRAPKDMTRFKQLTEGTSVIMGRKTFESIGKPLPKRQNIVLSSGFSAEGVLVCQSVEEALMRAEYPDLFFIGGARVYRDSVRYCESVYETVIEAGFLSDVKIPVDLLKGFEKVQSYSVEDLSFKITFNDYRRVL